MGEFPIVSLGLDEVRLETADSEKPEDAQGAVLLHRLDGAAERGGAHHLRACYILCPLYYSPSQKAVNARKILILSNKGYLHFFADNL